MMESGLVKLTVQGVMPDAIPNSDSQVVILQDENKAHTLPIWVGVAEGTAIRLGMEGVIPPRPLSHDLLRNLSERRQRPGGSNQQPDLCGAGRVGPVGA